ATIRVIEGHIANVVIQGDVRDGGMGRHLAQSYGAELTAHKPVKLSDMERYLLLMDDLPGSTAKGLVRPSTTQAGAADLVVTFEHKPYEFSYSIDNRGSETVGPIQHSLIAAANSLFNMYDRTLFRVITTS